MVFVQWYPKMTCTVRVWQWGKMNIRGRRNAMAWSGSIPTAEEGACSNRRLHFFWKTGLLTDELLLPCIHIYLTEMWLGNGPGFTRSKSDPVHILETSHLPPQLLQAGGPMCCGCVHTKNGHPEDTPTSWVWPSEVLATPSNGISVLDKQLNVSKLHLQLEVILMCLMNERLVIRHWELKPFVRLKK